MTHRFPDFYPDPSDLPSPSSNPFSKFQKLSQPPGRIQDQDASATDLETLHLIREAANRQWRQLQDFGVETTQLLKLAGAIWESIKFQLPEDDSFGHETSLELHRQDEPYDDSAWDPDSEDTVLEVPSFDCHDLDEVADSNDLADLELPIDIGVSPIAKLPLDSPDTPAGHGLFDPRDAFLPGCSPPDPSAQPSHPQIQTSSSPVSGFINLSRPGVAPLIISVEGYFQLSFDIAEGRNDLIEGRTAVPRPTAANPPLN